MKSYGKQVDMGRMTFEEIDKLVTLVAKLYAINVYYPKEGFSQQDKDSILNTLHRYRGKHPHVSFLYVESTTGNVKGRKTIKTGKPGRPKKDVMGKKVVPHVHIAAIGTEDRSAYSYVEDVKKAINKRFQKKKPYVKRCKRESKGSREHAINYINYCLDQSDLRRTAGDFDFYKFENYPKLCE